MQSLYNNAKANLEKILNGKEFPEVNDENAMRYVELHRILERCSKSEDDKALLKKVQMSLNTYLAANGKQAIDDDATIAKYGTNMHSPGFQFIMRDIDIENDEFDYSFAVEELLKHKERNKLNESNGKKSLEILQNPYDNSKLQESLASYIKENNIPPLDRTNSSVDLGNGQFDKIATQQTEVCWALAGINALLTTDEGVNLLESNRYYDETTGVFAIHLKEAEENGFHGGIYYVTPEEIESAGATIADGEGDSVAYLIAIKKYFAEVEENPELKEKMEANNQLIRSLDEGNCSFRFFEILTGGQCVQYKWDDDIFPGIGNGTKDTVDFDIVRDIVENKRGAVTMVIAGHAISVVGYRDGKLLVQESTNSENFSEGYSYPIPYKERRYFMEDCGEKDEFGICFDLPDISREEYDKNPAVHTIFKPTEPINGALTYELSEKDFKGFINAVSFIQW